MNPQNPELTKLAKHRVALAYALACANKSKTASTNRRRMVEAFLTMPTFALQGLYDMHTAAPGDPNEAPPVDDAPAPEGDVPAEGAEMGAEGDMGDMGGDPGMDAGMGDMGGDPGMGDMGLGGGMGGAMGGDPMAEGSAAPAESEDLKAQNSALVSDIAKLEQDFAALQENLPEGGALDLSSILSSEALDDKAEQLPGDQDSSMDPAMNLTPESEEGDMDSDVDLTGGHQSSYKAAEKGPDETDDSSFEAELLGALQGVDNPKDPAIPQDNFKGLGQTEPILDQISVEDGDYDSDIPASVMSGLAPAAGTMAKSPAGMKAAGTVKKASANHEGGSKFLPSGTVAPPAQADDQVSRLAALLNLM